MDIIRFVAALLVIVSHAYPISQGAEVEDFLARFTEGSLGLGALAVSVFFSYGGFLICKSMFRLHTGKKYFKARVKRIFPPLIIVIACLTFVVGPLLSSLDWKMYFLQSTTYKFLLNAILIPVHNLPGVFVDNVYPNVVNGALWTLPVEFICYILCFLGYKMHMFNRKVYGIVLAGVGIFAFVIIFIYPVSLFYLSILRAIILFAIGIGMYLYQNKIFLNTKIAVGLTFLLVLSRYVGIFDFCFILFFPYIIFTVGYATKAKYSDFASRGEISYEVYLWGWPVQQTLCYLCGGEMNPYYNMLGAIVIAVTLGAIQSHIQGKVKGQLKFE